MRLRKKILCVDDDFMNIDIFRHILTPHHDVAFAQSGAEALEMATRFRPDLILLDIMMPGMNGYETCRRLRRLPELDAVRIALVSARAQAADRVAGYAAGADDYLNKPFDDDELVAKIAVLLRHRTQDQIAALRWKLFRHVSREAEESLTEIVCAAQAMAGRDDTDTDSNRTAARVVLRSSQSLRDRIDQCTFLGRLLAGEVPLKPEPVSLEGLLQELLGREGVVSTDADALNDGEDDLVLADPSVLRRCLESLVAHVSDSRTSRPESPVITRTEGSVTLDVTLAPGAENIAVPRSLDFRMGDDEGSPSTTELDLALISEITEAHGGTFTTTARADGNIVLSLRLPAADLQKAGCPPHND